RYQPARIEIEGDWSSASYLLALGASCGNIGIDNLDKASLQGDRVILEHLRNMGVDVRASAGIVTAQKSPLRGINADLSDCIDLLPTMAVLAAQANGKSEFTGIERARIKESNRVRAVFENLKRLGIQVTEMEDRLIIIGAKTPVQEETAKEKAQRVNLGIATELDSYGDHRIAMAFGVLGAAWGGITIKGAECVAKTFPTFWETLESVGVKLERNAE
ncbi:MAG: 3-phosphoshikimate 1-carboxyvinyltransferase, partial [Dehalococcoidales bacterium]|nr:3-phosphoshikimate 1-carboxyvinyltransferase [Dehalococcoidales bacterium]